jgi:DNA-binding NarL/FixJ family response regulator
MKKTLNVLLVDDEPYIIEAYSNYLNQFKLSIPNYCLNIISAECSDSTIAIINSRNEDQCKPIDLALIDMRLPTSKNGEFKSGEDLSMYLQKAYPNIKIIIITAYSETLILTGVLQNVNPIGMLIKSDINGKILLEALKRAINNKPYYSIGVLNILRKKLSSSMNLDPIDRLMLYELSKGTKTKDLVKFLPLSLGAIEKRKRNIRLRFNAKCKDDQVLVATVLKKGFI